MTGLSTLTKINQHTLSTPNRDTDRRSAKPEHPLQPATINLTKLWDGAGLDEAGRGEGCLTCEVRPISICGALDPSELDELEALSERCSFAARQPVAMQGDPADVIYNVTSGMLRVYKLLADGRRQIVGFLLPGDFFGLALAERFAFSADAVGPTTVCRFRRSSFAALLDRKPHLLRRLHEAAAHEMTVAQDHMVLLGRHTAEVRVVLFLMAQRERWARCCGRLSVTVPLPMGRAEIGDYLGLSIETVSRTLNLFARQKLLLIVPNGVRLLDIPRLEEIAAAG